MNRFRSWARRALSALLTLLILLGTLGTCPVTAAEEGLAAPLEEAAENESLRLALEPPAAEEGEEETAEETEEPVSAPGPQAEALAVPPAADSLLLLSFTGEDGAAVPSAACCALDTVSAPAGLTVLEAYSFDETAGAAVAVPRLAVLPALREGERLSFFGLEEDGMGGYTLFEYAVKDYLCEGDSVELPLAWYPGFALVRISETVEDEIELTAPDGAEAAFAGRLPAEARVLLSEASYSPAEEETVYHAWNVAILDGNGAAFRSAEGEYVTVTVSSSEIASALADGRELEVLCVSGACEKTAEILLAEGDTLSFKAEEDGLFVIRERNTRTIADEYATVVFDFAAVQTEALSPADLCLSEMQEFMGGLRVVDWKKASGAAVYVTALPELAAGQVLSLYGLVNGVLTKQPLIDAAAAGSKVFLPAEEYDGFALVRETREVPQTITVNLPATRSAAGTEMSLTGLLPVGGKVEAYAVSFGSDDGAETLLAWDLTIRDGKGELWQPLAGNPISVSVRDDRIGAALAEGKRLRVLHMRGDAKRSLEEVDVLSSEGDTLVFSAAGFSAYAVQIVLEKTIVASDGKSYKITVTYDYTAALPEDAELRVSELTAEESGYADYISDTAAALYLSPEDLGYTKLFDISIVDGKGTEYQPYTDVAVTVELLDAEEDETEDLRVVHFGEENRELEATVEGSTLSFETDGFSLFSFTDVSLIERIFHAILGGGDDVLYENDDIELTGRMPVLGSVEATPVTVEIEGQPALVAYDVKIYSNPLARALGITWQPTAGAIRMRVKSGAFSGEENALRVFHLEDEAAQPELVTEAPLTDGWVEFDAERFSVYAFTGTIEKIITAEDGSTYRITVSYGEAAGFPEDADLDVTELLGDEFASYVDRGAAAMDASGFEYARVFDIRIVDGEGNELQPAAPVDVTIELLDRDAAPQPFSVLHFAGEEETVEALAAETEGNAVSFVATGFSAYAIVEGPGSFSIGVTVQSPAELSETYNDPETGGQGFYISYKDTKHHYTSATLNGNSAFVEKDDYSNAAVWYFESAGAADTYYIYTIVDGAPNYMKNPSGNLMSLVTEQTDASAFELSRAADGMFYFKVKNQNKWFQHSNGGSGMRLYTDKNNAVNSRLFLTYAYSTVIPDDPFGLDGRTLGLMFWSGGLAGKALMASSSAAGMLDAKTLTVMSHKDNNNDKLFVPSDSDITMWSFEWVDDDKYYVTATVEGSKQYLTIDAANAGGLTLQQEPDPARSLITVTPGTGLHEGQLCLQAGSHTLTYSGNANTGFGVGGSMVGSEWLYPVMLSELTTDYFRTYSASKVSVSDPGVGNGSQVIVYTRTWNNTTKKYEYSAIDSDGSLLPVYESGDVVEWVGAQLNNLLWNFVEYYDEVTGEPNGYFELYNAYSESYIAPQGTQILSPDTLGINMPGRMGGFYYTKILAWDDHELTYVGLKVAVVDGKKMIVTCPMDEADDFYFAIMHELPVDDQLTTVPTVDHEQYGITMRIFNYHATANDENHNMMSKFLGNGQGGQGTTLRQGLLSTNLVNGYPTVVHGEFAGQSLGLKYAEAEQINHLFIQSTYSATGYYEFDSSQNFASLHDDIDGDGSRDFVVYKELGSYDSIGFRHSLSHGQFLPFNDLAPGVFATVNGKNLYPPLVVNNNSDVELPESDPRKYERIYNVEHDSKKVDCYFGVELEASFTQTPSGHDAWGHDIIYEFTGDDDFWLYVDGELVIDLGGIHSAVPGSVNFATGEVMVNGVQLKLYDLFYNNYLNRDGHTAAQAEAYVSRLFVKNDAGQWVFKNNTSHTMKIFYLERGAGASNLHMRFNLASVKPGTVELSKTLSQQDSEDELNDSVYAAYLYQVYYRLRAVDTVTLVPEGTPTGPVTWSSANTGVVSVDPSTGVVTAEGKGNATITAEYDGTSEEFLLDVCMSEGRYYIAVYQNGELLERYVQPTAHLLGEISGEEGNVLYKDTTNRVPYLSSFTIPRTSIHYEHLFKLKPGETAVITLPEVVADYCIKECGVSENVYSSVKVNGTEVAGVSVGENRNDYGIDYASSDARPTVLFDNEVRKLRNLTISKTLFDVNDNPITDSAEFNFRLYLATEYDVDLNGLEANMEPYYVKDPSGNYCRWDSSQQAFVSLGVTDFHALTAAQRASATFHTSMYGSISKIRSGYSVEVRGLLPGTQYRVEERPSEIPDGYSFKKYEFDDTAAEVSRVDAWNNQIPGVVDTIVADRDSTVDVQNFKGFGLRVNKKWTDASFMQSRAPVFFAVFTADDNGVLTLIPDLPDNEPSVKMMPYDGQQTLYWYYNRLPVTSVTDFSRYVIREVTVSDPVIENGVLTGYSSLQILSHLDPLTIFGRQKDESQDSPYTYTVLYGEAATSPNTNVRVFPVTNDRPSIRLFKTKWDGTPLAGAVFTLTDASGQIEIGTFTSDEEGMITLVFLGSNKNYLLTEVSTPRPYQGMQESMSIMINDQEVTISGVDAAEYVLNTTDTPMTLTIRNHPSTLQVIKYGESDDGREIPLEGVTFALHKRKTVNNVTNFDVNPEAGYEALVTDANGVVPRLDNTLPPGTYELREVTPAGYKPMKYIYFTVSPTGKISLGAYDERTGALIPGTEPPARVTLPAPAIDQNDPQGTLAYVLSIRNEKLPVAPTGVKTHVFPFALLGLAGLFLAALALPLLRRRRKS